MLIHITRHGQPLQRNIDPLADAEFPRGDPPLTPLGREQAQRLGRRLATMGFAGVIYSSPYRRTLETAQCIAEQVGRPVLPEPMIQEWVPQPGMPTFQPMTPEQIRRQFANVTDDVELASPWFATGPEQMPEVGRRVRPFMQRLVAQRAGDVLLVGHGATVVACRDAIVSGDERGRYTVWESNWNCALTTCGVHEDGAITLDRLTDTTHLPPDIITSNEDYRRDSEWAQ